MDWLQTLLASSTTPAITAFILGLLMALSPCPLVTNIAAIGYIGKHIESRKEVFLYGLLYALGRAIAYSLLGVVLINVLQRGASVFGIQWFVATYGAKILPPTLLLAGVFMLLGGRLKFPSYGYGDKSAIVARRGRLGALTLGVLFAMAFCPTSAVLYFGVLVPMSVSATMGYFLPSIFAIATSIPVLLVAWILAFSAGRIGMAYGKMKLMQKWLNYIVGILFIGLGIYYCRILL